MRTILFLFCFLFSSFAFANEAERDVDPSNPAMSIERSIYAHLDLQACSISFDSYACRIEAVMPHSQKIQLSRVIYERDSVLVYRGHYSQVTEYEGVRYIGVVTIERSQYFVCTVEGERVPFVKDSCNGQWIEQSYIVNVEILGESGKVAEMSTSVNSLNELGRMTLLGPEVINRMENYRVRPSFTVGPPNCLLTECLEEPILEPSPRVSSSTSWDLLLGSR